MMERLEESDYLLGVYDGHRMGGLSLNISETGNALDFDLAMEVIPFFRLKPDKAKKILKKIKKELCAWRDFADSYGIPKSEQGRMEKCFRL